MSPEDQATLREVALIQARMEQRLEKVLDDHETRLRRVERWAYALPATSLAAVLSALFAITK